METAHILPAWAQHLSFTAFTPDKPHPYIGKCAHCKRVVRIMSTTHKQLTEKRTPQGHTVLDVSRHYTCDIPHGRHDKQSGTWSIPCPTEGCVIKPYEQQAWITLKSIDGFTVPEVKCDGRCTSAKGHKCECSCSGENHGSDHTA